MTIIIIVIAIVLTPSFCNLLLLWPPYALLRLIFHHSLFYKHSLLRHIFVMTNAVNKVIIIFCLCMIMLAIVVTELCVPCMRMHVPLCLCLSLWCIIQ